MYLNQRTRDTLERIIGKSADDLKKMDLIEEKSFVEEKTGKNLIFSKKMDSRMTWPLLGSGTVESPRCSPLWTSPERAAGCWPRGSSPSSV